MVAEDMAECTSLGVGSQACWTTQQADMKHRQGDMVPVPVAVALEGELHIPPGQQELYYKTAEGTAAVDMLEDHSQLSSA